MLPWKGVRDPYGFIILLLVGYGRQYYLVGISWVIWSNFCVLGEVWDFKNITELGGTWFLIVFGGFLWRKWNVRYFEERERTPAHVKCLFVYSLFSGKMRFMVGWLLLLLICCIHALVSHGFLLFWLVVHGGHPIGFNCQKEKKKEELVTALNI